MKFDDLWSAMDRRDYKVVVSILEKLRKRARVRDPRQFVVSSYAVQSHVRQRYSANVVPFSRIRRTKRHA